MANPRKIFVGAGFAKHEKVFVHYQVKTMDTRGRGPALRVRRVVLGF